MSTQNELDTTEAMPLASAPHKGHTRRELLRLGRKLLETQGYNGFSFHDLALAIGVRKASVHHHFPSKEDLVIAVLQEARDELLRWKNRNQSRGSSPAEELSSWIEVFEHIAVNPGRICPAGALTGEWNTLSEAVHESVMQLMEVHFGWLRELLTRGQQEGVFQIKAPISHVALWLASGCEGALLLIRAGAHLRASERLGAGSDSPLGPLALMRPMAAQLVGLDSLPSGR